MSRRRLQASMLSHRDLIARQVTPHDCVTSEHWPQGLDRSRNSTMMPEPPFLHLRHSACALRLTRLLSFRVCTAPCPRVRPTPVTTMPLRRSLCHHEPRFVLRVVQRTGARFPSVFLAGPCTQPSASLTTSKPGGSSTTPALVFRRLHPGPRLSVLE